ncbi:ABC transporter permease [Nakamurella silvestris]|nr:ABC transporter permease [Nakamurella silvestris]
MSTTDFAPNSRQGSAGRPIQKQGFGTLLRVEFRKMVNTRSGPAVLATAVAIALVALVWKIVRGGDGPATWHDYSAIMQVVGMVLPIIGLLAMTSEWTQRTALTTFTLSPRRGRVLAAKFGAAAGLALITLVVIIGLIVAAVYIGGAVSGHDVAFDGFLGDVRGLVILTVLQMTMAAGFGALAAQTAVAVACYFVAPTFVTIVGTQLLHDNAKWLDVFAAYDRLASGNPWADGVQSITSIAFWVVLPTAIGVWRSLHREVK